MALGSGPGAEQPAVAPPVQASESEPTSGSPSSVDATAAHLAATQAHYDGVRDLVARFVQTSHVASLGRNDVSSGRVWVERPGRMRWEYQEPEPHTIAIADGALRLYSPAEGQLQIASLAQGAFSPTALDFLLGEGRLADTFRAEARGTTERGELRLRLVPKTEARFQELELWVAPDTHQLRGSVVVDQLGNKTEIRFEDIVENGGIDAARFRVDVPKGTEVIDLR